MTDDITKEQAKRIIANVRDASRLMGCSMTSALAATRSATAAMGDVYIRAVKNRYDPYIELAGEGPIDFEEHRDLLIAGSIAGVTSALRSAFGLDCDFEEQLAKEYAEIIALQSPKLDAICAKLDAGEEVTT